MNKKNYMLNIAFSAFILAGAVLLNLYGSILSDTIILPLYLDSLCTIGIVALYGIIPGLICAVCTNSLMAFFMHSPILFCICHICTVAFAWVVFQNFKKKNGEKPYSIDCFLWAGIWAALSNGFLGNLIANLVYAANPGRASATVIVQGIFCAIPNLGFASNFGGLLENIADKTLSAILSFGLYRMAGKIHSLIGNQ